MDEDEDSDVMDECAAAMVLMRLSCSPHSPRWEGTFVNLVQMKFNNLIYVSTIQIWQPGRVITAAIAAAVELFRGAEAYPAAATRPRTLHLELEQPAGLFRPVPGASLNFVQLRHRLR